MSVMLAYEDAWPAPRPIPVIMVRRVGANVFEARTEDGMFSAVGFSERGAVFALVGSGKLPSHHESDVVIIPDPKPTADPDYDL